MAYIKVTLNYFIVEIIIYKIFTSILMG